MTARVLTIKGVAVEPPATIGVKHKVVNGMKTLDLRGLTPLKVVLPAQLPFFGTIFDLEPGDSILVAAAVLASQSWAKDSYEYEGKSFVIVPFETIFGIISDDGVVAPEVARQ